MLTESIFYSPAVAPPLNVQATQASDSVLVKVSWSPPSGGAANVTGYRIFYGDGKNMALDDNDLNASIHQCQIQNASVFIRAESAQLPSKLILLTVNVTGEL